MKAKLYFLSIVVSCMSFTSCGTGTTGSATGTTAAESQTTALGSGLLGNVLTSLLKGSTTNESSIVGTWTYSAPKVAFESENVLAQLGSTVASSKIETALGNQLKKVGFTAGATQLTLKDDNSCTLTVGERTITGTYTFDSQTKQLNITGALGLSSVRCTVAVVGNTMNLLFDADKLLAVASGLSSTAKTGNLSSLLKSYSGLKLGWTMTK